MNVVVITPTGDRPASLIRQAKYISRSILPVGVSPSWIVIDDGSVPSTLPKIDGWRTMYSRAPAMQGISLLRNLVVGLSEAVLLNPDYIFIWEDDDWHSSERIIWQLRSLEEGKRRGVHLHGASSSLYYNVPYRLWRLMPNPKHASLFETCFSKELLFPMIEFLKAVNGDRISIDRSIWSHFITNAKSDEVRERHSVGIKGMPGRAGIGCGHRPTPLKNQWQSDPDGLFLVAAVGEKDAAEILAEGGVR